MKNICQCCLLDLEFGLPVQVRDKYSADSGQMPNPTSREGIAYQIQAQLSAQAAIGDSSQPLAIESGSGASRLSANPELQRLARTTPYYDRNQSPICSFFQKGECNRGDSCPYRHEKKVPSTTQQQKSHNIQDRFHGVSDPVAQKILKSASTRLANFPSPPEDNSITTLFITGLPENVNEERCMHFIETQFKEYGNILKIKIVKAAKVGFVEFENRLDAEKAISEKFNHPSMTFVDGEITSRLKVSWARPKTSPGASSSVPYPSMDPRNMGNAPISRTRPQ